MNEVNKNKKERRKHYDSSTGRKKKCNQSD